MEKLFFEWKKPGGFEKLKQTLPALQHDCVNFTTSPNLLLILSPILSPIFFPNLDQSFTVWPPQLFTNLF
jgi:hypothetical protein